MSVETLDILPGEGDTKTVTSRLRRKGCDVCGEAAHQRHAFLFLGMRSNPKSSAYGRDDCSWCSDVDVFTCRACSPETPDGCADGHTTFYAVARFAHMFLEWREVSAPLIAHEAGEART